MALVTENELEGLDLTDVVIDLNIPVETAIILVERETGREGNGTDAARSNGVWDIQKNSLQSSAILFSRSSTFLPSPIAVAMSVSTVLAGIDFTCIFIYWSFNDC